MNNTNLFLFNGDGGFSSQRFAFNSEKSVVIRNEDSELVVDGVRDVEISYLYGSKVKIKIGQKVTYYPLNKKIAINETEDRVVINIVRSDEDMKPFETMADEQLARSLKYYIHENAPDMYTEENLNRMKLCELKEIKESMDDLANNW